MTFDIYTPRESNGQFAEKTGSAAEVSLDTSAPLGGSAPDMSGSFDFAVFQMPSLSRLDKAGPQNPMTDKRLTESARVRLGRLVSEREVTAVVNDGPTMEAPVTMLYVGADAFFYAGDAPGTNEEALANVARLAANGDEGAAGFLTAALGDEAPALIELVAEEKL